nr:hypothetical protein [Tanacetum cinerariifolium]
MGCLPRSALFFITESLSLTRSPNLVVHGERVKIQSNIRRNVTTEIVPHTVTIQLEIRTIRLEETGIKYLLRCKIDTMMAPGRSLMASFENLESFLPMNTTSNYLIRTYSEKAAEAIPLRSRIIDIEATDATRTGELESLKERNVSELEATCFGLRDEVAGYKLFKEQVEAIQDEQVKVLSDRVSDIDVDSQPRPKTCYYEVPTISWISGCPGRALRRATDKGMQDGLKADVDHGKAGRGLDGIAAYDPSVLASKY